MSLTILAAAAAALAGGLAGLAWGRCRWRPRGAGGPAPHWIADELHGHAWTNDPDGNFIAISPGLERFFGFDAAWFDRKIGRADFEAANRELQRTLVHPEDIDATTARWRHALASGEPFVSVHRVRRFDGVYRWHRVVAIASRDTAGRITGWHGVGFDIEDESARRPPASAARRRCSA